MNPTTDHKAIRNWARLRGALPAAVRGTGDGVPAVLRFIIPGANYDNRNLEEVSWELFFARFDLLGLAFVFQEVTPTGERSNRNEILQPQQETVAQRFWN